MQKLIGFNIQRNKKLLVSDIIKFFEVRGYILTDANAKGMVFKKGHLLGNLFSLNPAKWRTIVNIEIVKKERLNYNIYAKYHFSEIGLFISQEESDYFNEEINAFPKAIQEFEVNVDQIEELAFKTSKSNIKYMLLAFVFGILSSLLLIFSTNIFLEGNLPVLAASAISGASILGSYYLLVKLKR